jgi:hypothetical protein
MYHTQYRYLNIRLAYLYLLIPVKQFNLSHMNLKLIKLTRMQKLAITTRRAGQNSKDQSSPTPVIPGSMSF